MRNISFFVIVFLMLAMPLAAKQPSPYPGWSPVRISTGDQPTGVTCTPVYSKLNNSLLLEVGGTCDAIVKLRTMKGDSISSSDPVIRVVYVKAGESYRVRNLPECVCYLEVAYGTALFRNDKQKKQVRFMEDRYFASLMDTFDFHTTSDTLPDGSISTKIPSYSMYLQMTVAKQLIEKSAPADLHALSAKAIEEDEFFR